MDFGVELEGYFGDAALTVPVGKIAPGAKSCCASRASRSSTRSRKSGRATGWAMFRRPCSSGSRGTVFRWCANLSATASAPRCTRSRRFRITAPRAGAAPAGGHGPGHRADGEFGRSGREFWTTIGRRSRPTAATRRISSTPSRSPANGPWILTRPARSDRAVLVDQIAGLNGKQVSWQTPLWRKEANSAGKEARRKRQGRRHRSDGHGD